jgi:hypothetical protein
MQVLRNRPKKSGKTKYTFVKGNTSAAPRKRNAASSSVGKAPARNSVKKTHTSKTRASAKSQIKTKTRAKRITTRKSVILDTPGWKDLKTAGNGRVESKGKESRLLNTLSTVRFSLGILVVAVLVSLYVGHVQATQDLVNDVYLARKENLSLSTQLDKTQGAYNTKIGPAVIYPLAYELGLHEGRGSENPVIVGAELN